MPVRRRLVFDELRSAALTGKGVAADAYDRGKQDEPAGTLLCVQFRRVAEGAGQTLAIQGNQQGQQQEPEEDEIGAQKRL